MRCDNIRGDVSFVLRQAATPTTEDDVQIIGTCFVHFTSNSPTVFTLEKRQEEDESFGSNRFVDAASLWTGDVSESTNSSAKQFSLRIFTSMNFGKMKWDDVQTRFARWFCETGTSIKMWSATEKGAATSPSSFLSAPEATIVQPPTLCASAVLSCEMQSMCKFVHVVHQNVDF